MLIIGIQNPKGGSGKTTTTTCFAGGFQKHGYSVGVADTDPQRGSCEWYANNDSNTCAATEVHRLSTIDEIKNIRADDRFWGCDVVLVDGAADGFRELSATARVADILLLVTSPSPADTMPMAEVMDFTEGSKAVKAFIFNNVHNNEDDLLEATRDGLKDAFKLPVLTATIPNAPIFKIAWSEGETVFSYPTFWAAQRRVEDAISEVLALLEGNKND